MKTCTKCKKALPATQEYYSKDKKSKDCLNWTCKGCDAKSSKGQHLKAERQASKAAYAKTPKGRLAQRKGQVMFAYGLTLQDLQDMLDKQKGCCAACGNSLINPKTKHLYQIDHNHTTGEVRGLLCKGCNIAYGHLREDELAILGLLHYHRSTK